MQRKIIKQGIGGHTIFLPISWVRSHDLVPGDTVTIDESSESLVIRAKGTKERIIKTKIEHDNQRFVRIKLQNLYRQGYDIIHINYFTPRQAKLIKSITEKYLLGFEITKQTSKEIIIENIAEPSSEKHDVIFKQIFFMINEMFSELKENINEGNLNITSVKDYASKITRFDNFSRRIIFKKKFNEEGIYFYWSLSSYLNLIARSILHLYEKLLLENENKKISKSNSGIILEQLTVLQKHFDTLRKGLFTSKLSTIEKVTSQSNILANNTLPDLMMNTKGIDTTALHYCNEIARLLYLCSSPCIGIVLHQVQLNQEEL